MHVETYPAFFTPRDKEPSLSSSEEKSLEFDWLERKRTRKQKYEKKIEQVLYIFNILIDSTYFYFYLSISVFYNGCKGIYIEKFFQPS